MKTSRRSVLSGLAVGLVGGAMPFSAWAGDMWPVSQLRWQFFTDGVMGGVSEGQAFLTEDGLRLTGTVSTANNGGFIQVRAGVEPSAFSGATGVTARVRGDGQQYFIHIRTAQTRLPWQYYQAAFTAERDWTSITLPFDQFTAEGRWLPDRINPEDIRTIALVAYGRDHAADVWLSQIGPL